MARRFNIKEVGGHHRPHRRVFFGGLWVMSCNGMGRLGFLSFFGFRLGHRLHDKLPLLRWRTWAARALSWDPLNTFRDRHFLVRHEASWYIHGRSHHQVSDSSSLGEYLDCWVSTPQESASNVGLRLPAHVAGLYFDAPPWRHPDGG